MYVDIKCRILFWQSQIQKRLFVQYLSLPYDSDKCTCYVRYQGEYVGYIYYICDHFGILVYFNELCDKGQ
mgnify:CR=1 FL=1